MNMVLDDCITFRRLAVPPQSTAPAGSSPRHCAFTLVELLVVISIIGVLLGLLIPAIQAAREASRRSACASNLHQLGLAIQTYHDDQKRFPAGANLHVEEMRVSISWRVMLLPYLEEQALYDQTNPTPNGGAANDAGRRLLIDVYLCPSDPPVGNLIESNYSGVAGPGRDGDLQALTDPTCGNICKDGLFFPGSRTKISDIEDGMSHTLAIGERYYTFRDWMSGASWIGDPPIQICTGATSNIRYPINAEGYYVRDSEVPASPLKTMLLNDLYFGSFHSGGAQFCFADGSVQMIKETIEFSVFEDLSTIAGNEVISDNSY
jgi:prepilin-type N-terminal cleavage/methylation domain-containing protein/prepilin-type processing-associated H-X9-DG protein